MHDLTSVDIIFSVMDRRSGPKRAKNVSQLKFLYRAYAKKNYTKLKLQFPRLRQSQIIQKILREWYSMTRNQILSFERNLVENKGNRYWRDLEQYSSDQSFVEEQVLVRQFQQRQNELEYECGSVKPESQPEHPLEKKQKRMFKQVSDYEFSQEERVNRSDDSSEEMVALKKKIEKAPKVSSKRKADPPQKPFWGQPVKKVNKNYVSKCLCCGKDVIWRGHRMNTFIKHAQQCNSNGMKQLKLDNDTKIILDYERKEKKDRNIRKQIQLNEIHARVLQMKRQLDHLIDEAMQLEANGEDNQDLVEQINNIRNRSFSLQQRARYLENPNNDDEEE